MKANGKTIDFRLERIAIIIGKVEMLGDSEIVGAYYKGEKAPRYITVSEVVRDAEKITEVIYDSKGE